MPTDLHTRAIVLRRTKYGESDRILNLLTPEGKISAIARGVRKEKSRLAGAIELFSVADVVIHRGRGDLGVLTSAKMLQFYNNIMADLTRLELASNFLKKLGSATEQVSSPEHFSLLEQSLKGLNQGLSLSLVETWFLLNLARICGEELNLVCDIYGNNLDPTSRYVWDTTEATLRPNEHGPIGVDEIKFARFLVANPLFWATKVNRYEDLLPQLEPLSRQYS